MKNASIKMGSAGMENCRVISSSVSWHATVSDSLEAYTGWSGLAKRPVPMPEDVGKGFFESLVPKPGMAIVRGSHTFSPERAGQLIPLAETNLMLNEPAIIVQSAAAGRAIVKDSVLEKEYILSNQQSIVQRLDDVKFSRVHDASQPNDLCYLVMTQSTFYNLLGEGNADKLLLAQKLTDKPSAGTLNLPFNMSRILHSCMTNQLVGDFRELYGQGAILEYMSLMSNFVLGKDELSTCSRRTRLIRQLHEELMSMQGCVPNLTDLSAKYGLSTRTLNDAFKKEYGQSIYAYVKEQRLAGAHTTLLETDTPIKVVAAEFGYSHVTNFMLAFKKKFGYPPGSLRR